MNIYTPADPHILPADVLCGRLPGEPEPTYLEMRAALERIRDRHAGTPAASIAQRCIDELDDANEEGR